jgi:hypothetical protein
MLGSGYRRWGAIAEIKSGTGGPRHSGKMAGSSTADNEPPLVNGSTARMYRNSGTEMSFVGGSSVTAIPNNFWTSVDYESPDINADTADGTFTVVESKSYSISARVKLSSLMSLTTSHLVLQTYRSGSWTNLNQYGESAYNTSAGWGLTGNWIQYLNSGEKCVLLVFTLEQQEITGAIPVHQKHTLALLVLSLHKTNPVK